MSTDEVVAADSSVVVTVQLTENPDYLTSGQPDVQVDTEPTEVGRRQKAAIFHVDRSKDFRRLRPSPSPAHMSRHVTHRFRSRDLRRDFNLRRSRVH